MESINSRPTVVVRDPRCGSERVLTPLHGHEFGPGYDIQYKANGVVMHELHGLKPEEAEYLMRQRR